MSKIHTLTSAEISQIKNIINTREFIASNLGDIEIKLYELNKAKETYLNQLLDLKIQESEISNELTKKYGSGEINIEDGIIKID